VIRARYGLQEDPCNDCCATCFCPCCAITQDWREMVSRGPPPKMTMGSPVVVQQGYPATQPVTTTTTVQQYSPQPHQATYQQTYQQPPQPQYGQPQYQQPAATTYSQQQY